MAPVSRSMESLVRMKVPSHSAFLLKRGSLTVAEMPINFRILSILSFVAVRGDSSPTFGDSRLDNSVGESCTGISTFEMLTALTSMVPAGANWLSSIFTSEMRQLNGALMTVFSMSRRRSLKLDTSDCFWACRAVSWEGMS